MFNYLAKERYLFQYIICLTAIKIIIKGCVCEDKAADALWNADHYKHSHINYLIESSIQCTINTPVLLQTSINILLYTNLNH